MPEEQPWVMGDLAKWPEALPPEDAFEAAARRTRAPYAQAYEAAQQRPTHLRSLGTAVMEGVQTPGSLMAPNPYEPGSEEWQWYENNKSDVATGWGAGTALGMLAPAPVAGGGMTVGSGMRRGAKMGDLAETAPPPMGHNNPPSRIEVHAGSTTYGPPREPYGPPTPAWEKLLPKAVAARRSTEIPDIRPMSTDEAVKVARTQPHLIKAGDQSEGFYIGSPRDIGSRADLRRQRNAFDEYIAADPRGGDWYDRYRAGVAEVTGNDPVQNKWMSNQEGQWSAGVDPGSEVHFALKENNAAIAGAPVKAARPAQHEAHLAAIAAKDPALYQLGDKTGEYAQLVNPDRARPPGATGVNDFRHARNWGFTEADGEAQKGALTAAQHKFLDYETALSVDRANRMNLGGRSNWTGEQLQAAPWVRQKALDIMSRNPKLTYEEAVVRANRTIADYFDRHTFAATHEAQPGADVPGHMMGSVAAPEGARVAYAADPRSNWATAPGERDAIYAGMGIPETGVNMRVRPSVPSQGLYTRPDGTIETNPGQVARPMGTFDTGDAPFKTTTPADQSILNAGEAVRGYLDAQNASAWHKTWPGGPTKESTSLFFPREGPAGMGDLLGIGKAGEPHGLGYTVDTGKGITLSRFGGDPEGANLALTQALKRGDFTQFGEPQRVRSGPGDSGYIDFVDKWKEGAGSGAATRHMLEYVNKTPQLREALNSNPYLGERALARAARDTDWAKEWGAPRADIQNARRIIGEGPGWVDRLEAALKAGAILPAAAAALYAAAMSEHPSDGGL